MPDHQTEADLILTRYERARLFEQATLTKTMVRNAALYPKWIGESDTFIYERETKSGKEYRLISADDGVDEPAFDHAALSEALSESSGNAIDAKDLPINQVNVSLSPARIEFDAFGKHWLFHEQKNLCEEISAHAPNWLVSPDGEKAVFVRDFNLWIRDLNSGQEKALTTDGERYYAYGSMPERVDIASEFSPPLPYAPLPQALWSPNSQKLLTFQTDERKVLPLPVTAYVPKGDNIRPQTSFPRYALPGDKHIAEYRMLVLDVGSERAIEAQYPKVLDTGVMPGPIMRQRVWWSKDGHTAYFVDMSRCEKQALVVALDTQNGMTRVLFEESSETFIDLNLMNEEPCSLLPIPESNELIWFSERSGWAHLYLYDLNSGECKHPITEGQWLVREVLGFDAKRRDVYFQAAGRVTDRDPYYREICRANIDTGEIFTLASSDHDYVMHRSGGRDVFSAGAFGRDVSGVSGLAPTGNYFVTTRTRVDQSSVSELRCRDGLMVMELDTADTTNLPEGWRWPEPVKLLSADGKTDIYGVVFRPTDFDPGKKYPVIDYALGLSIISLAPKGAFFSDSISAVCYPAAALAELGFIVVIIDGRGTTFRSKSFHDESYGQLLKASNLEDHIAGITQLGKRYSYMDLDRVGITGPGGCNAPAYGLLAYPDFYKVGVACSIFDTRLALGFESYRGQSDDDGDEHMVLGSLASNLKGKLLLIHGMLDNFFQTAGMFQLVDALARTNKKFDMLVLPNGGHMFREGYPLCRAWDYMVTHLQGSEPPVDFKLKAGAEFALEQLEARSGAS